MKKSNFKRLLGVWKTSGQVISEHGNLELSGFDSYELILSGNYILHKANVKMGTDISETFEIIKFDNIIEEAVMTYYNSEGEDGTMRSEIKGNSFIIEGSGLRFQGSINNENSEVKGKWFKQTMGDKWIEFIELKLEKQ